MAAVDAAAVARTAISPIDEFPGSIIALLLASVAAFVVLEMPRGPIYPLLAELVSVLLFGFAFVMLLLLVGDTLFSEFCPEVLFCPEFPNSTQLSSPT